MTERWLAEVPALVLEDLARAVESGTLRCPFDRQSLGHAGFGGHEEPLACLAGLPTDAVLAVTRAILADRSQRRSPELELVWTGPEGTGSASRDTAVLLARLLASARESVLIAGYAFDHGTDVLRPLSEVMAAHGVPARVVLNIPRMPHGVGDVRSHVHDFAAEFLRANWPFNVAPPELLYDPRTVSADSTASMHAKCVVVDAERTLITSANFTERGQRRNIECGVFLRDREFAASMLRQWENLIGQGFLSSISSDE